MEAANEKRLSLEIYISRLETEAELKDKMQKELQTALDEVSGKAQVRFLKAKVKVKSELLHKKALQIVLLLLERIKLVHLKQKLH